MISTAPTTDGYIFYNSGEIVAVGSYTGGDFLLLETDNTTTNHRNGMIAMSYCRRKYTPEYYTMPVKHPIPERVADARQKFEQYKKHFALQGVHPVVTEQV